MQLFCFSFAGGTSSFFDKLEAFLEDKISLVKLEYAGHGRRHHEPFYHDFSELADDMIKLILSEYHENEPYAFFGYSMGSIACIESLKIIITKKIMPMPRCIFLAAHPPCVKSELTGYSDSELDDYVKRRIIAFGGVPDSLQNNSVFWRCYLPIYKADFSLIANYNFSKIDLNLKIPAVIFYSEEDTPYKEMCLWKSFFSGNINYYCYVGNHFFLLEHCSEIAKNIQNCLNNITE